ncbi:putative mitochondrial protein (mitochondrion) [Arabidopsis thaliana]|jgi:hypothetical protein|uniref:Uncharacterized mitochondrial protein AtMg00630 n=3 Tax=Arabidopsis TaxID=3701 RepID=M630_ARATH|nr:RecName: Full=Uncharacterized mitochondrial protein AtMg00630; AltName: Full=ORF110b [Arabidopsis thaliana]KAG7528756.1 hypothetical protein ISN44_Un159g000220 [Arabidopsis suecica]KAG7529225.1 hypothetical protein ISN45_Un97g000010 [Arabidopsis thaliana x Arabidopsis arenosa]KAG7528807.1 hypothetical protein ISN44_Un156g000110 [Arabidopsis suecica]KAG7530636.1 hypothetical protein ISN45_Un26g000130 [Arabidopsis thaliana x Arabidopsis arenosa]KAG7640984.1 hypothetical protein ISN44_As02g010
MPSPILPMLPISHLIGTEVRNLISVRTPNITMDQLKNGCCSILTQLETLLRSQSPSEMTIFQTLCDRCCGAEVANEATVECGKTMETTNLTSGGRYWPFHNGTNLSRISL